MHQLPRVASFVAPKHPTELTDEDDEEFLRVIFLKNTLLYEKKQGARVDIGKSLGYLQSSKEAFSEVFSRKSKFPPKNC